MYAVKSLTKRVSECIEINNCISKKKLASRHCTSVSRYRILSPVSPVSGVFRRCPTHFTLSPMPTYFLVPRNYNSWYLFSTILPIFLARLLCHIPLSSICNSNSLPCRLQFKLLIYIPTNVLTQSLISQIPTIHSLAFAMLLFHIASSTSIIYIILQSSVHIHLFFGFVS